MNVNKAIVSSLIILLTRQGVLTPLGLQDQTDFSGTNTIYLNSYKGIKYYSDWEIMLSSIYYDEISLNDILGVVKLV